MSHQQNSAYRSQAILIAGMHRSGTSALTKVLSLLGADLPRNLLPALEANNATGFWESLDLVIIHDNLLDSAGSAWNDWTEFNPDWYETATAKRFRQQIMARLQQDFAASELFALKDPRVCRFMPFWLQILEGFQAEPFIIIPVRNPLEVARSLKTRDDMPLQKGAFLWLRHVLDAVHFSRGQHRVFIAYNQLLDDWKTVQRKISAQMPLRFPRQSAAVELEIDVYLDVRQQHNRETLESLRANADVHAVAGEAYEALLTLLENPRDEQALQTLENLRRQFNAHSRTYARLVQHEAEICRHKQQTFEVQLQAAEDKLQALMLQRDSRVNELEQNFQAQFQEQNAQWKQKLEEQGLQLKQKLRTQKKYLLHVSRNKERNIHQRELESSKRAWKARKNLLKQIEDLHLELIHKQESITFSSDIQLSDPNNKQLRKHEQSQALLLKNCGLFDVPFYQKQAHEIAHYPDGPYLHYLRIGARQGFNPHPLFSVAWYLSRNEDVRRSGANPFLHYCTDGGLEGRMPHPLFDAKAYLQEHPEVKEGGINPLLHFVQNVKTTHYKPHWLFDTAWYLLQHPELKVAQADPLTHYLQEGGKTPSSPHPLFDAEYYSIHSDVEASGLTALEHYVKYGGRWGYNIHPLFDSQHYVSQPGVTIPEGMPPLLHFLQMDNAEAISPCIFFDAAWYLEQNPDVRHADKNPLLHFIQYGSLDGRNPHPLFDLSWHRQEYGAELQHAEPLTAYVRHALSIPDLLADDETLNLRNPHLLFDSAYYYRCYQDAVVSGLDPLEHYLRHGMHGGYSTHPLFNGHYYTSQANISIPPGVSPLAHFLQEGGQQGHSPCIFFDAAWYLEQYSDVREAGRNPLLHYLQHGCHDGRAPHPLFDANWYRQQYAGVLEGKEPLTDYVLRGLDLADLAGTEETPAQRNPHPLFDGGYYRERYEDAALSGLDPLEHYLRHGMHGNYSTHPLFDGLYYNAQPGVIIPPGMPPLAHFLREGGSRGFSPCLFFDAAWYLENYPDVRKTGMNPLLHFLTHGSKIGLKPHPLFDTAWYRQQYAEHLKDAEPLTDYVTQGYKEGRNPNAWFDSAWYLEYNNDLSGKITHPFEHYLRYGIRENRDPGPVFHVRDYLENYPAAKEFPYGPLAYHLEITLKTPGIKQVAHPFAGQLVADPAFRKMLDYPVRKLEPPRNTFTQNQLAIHWVTCSFSSQGSGGHMTIFRFIRLFELIGHRQTIWIHNPKPQASAAKAYEDVVRHYQNIQADVRFLDDTFPEAQGDIIFATDWSSAWPVLSATRFKRRFYFVQDYEPAFYAAGGHSLAAEMTYKEDFDCVCAGPWLEKVMRERYGRWATKFWLCADQGIYFPPRQPPQNDIPRIAFYARFSTSRRAVELGLMALELLAGQGVRFQVEFFGSDQGEIFRHANFPCKDHGVLGSQQLGELYRSSDIGVVFSATNYSLVPQEMMSCDLPVLELDGENTRAVFPENTVILVNPHPAEIADQLANLIAHPELRQQIGQAGRAWASSFDWEQTAREAGQAIQARLENLGFERKAPEPSSLPKASVVIPTLNGGQLLLDVLGRLHTQKAPWPYEILVIDSGSDDGTLETLKTLPWVRLHQIDKTEFSHGGTRNLGVEMSRGEYIAFLTQDALPVDNFWLFHLVSLLEHYPDAAGAFGRHLPYETASPFVKRDLNEHFENLGKHPLFLSRDTDPLRYRAKETGWRQVLHFYSDNNSCLRRSAWKQIPYPVIEYGEDQVWAEQIIEAGYGKVYAINAVVYHSHDYDEKQTYERSRIEVEFFQKHFGYTFIQSQEQMQTTLQHLNERDRVYAESLGLGAIMLETQYRLNEARLQGYLDAAVQDKNTAPCGD